MGRDSGRLSARRGSSASSRRAAWRGGRGRGRGNSKISGDAAPVREDDGTQLAERFERAKLGEEVDEKLGFPCIREGERREGWLINMHPTLVKDPDWPSGKAAVDYYFIQDDGSMFKCTYLYEPYFHILCKSGTENIVEEWLKKRYEGAISRIVRQIKEDLKLPNHLMGYRRLCLQLCFRNISDLLAVRRDIVPLALGNCAKRDGIDAYSEVLHSTVRKSVTHLEIELEDDVWMETPEWTRSTAADKDKDPREHIVDAREFDIPYYLRVAIDNDIRVGLWYAVTFDAGQPLFSHLADRVKRADPVVMAFDIETTKAPLKFPDQLTDQIMMISYMVDGQGYLITNREIVAEDIEDFEYTPKEGYEGPFIIFNEPNEAATITRFFAHIQEARPTVMATFNGDFFDFPFLDVRARLNGIDMYLETGFARDSEDEYKSRACVHMDCFRWVKRDSYLPQGSQGLKAVTTAKLGYNPIELDPEVMTAYASEQPQVLAQYSVSDAVATYYLYMKYVHPFIFSLCNIIPLNPDEVLRKGSGTLCETLLMVEAYRAGIIMPNRHEEPYGRMYEGHLLASETYVGGHVEALEAGVFRSDIPTEFKIVPSAVQKLMDELDAALSFCIVHESKASLADVINYDEVKASIRIALQTMQDNPRRTDNPLIYHLDVAAMYPNIMLSNRLQPDSIVDESVCAVCDYNRPGKQCDRRLHWAWRGEFFPAQRDEFNMIKFALNQETFPAKRAQGPERQFHELTEAEQSAMIHKRLGDYSRKVYKKTKETKVENREAIVCQRENPFYVNTVRRFRDRRYEYKGLHKTWKKNLDAALQQNRSIADIDEARKMIVLFDSLQLAHKCILNSFYGYVMRKGARWHSMEMAGITCLTGATIIQMARSLVEQIGRPLELDTDGIWCMLPGIFPENFTFRLKNGKAIAFSYPCTMLNHLVHAKFTNHQYHDIDPGSGEYVIHSENSIFFELDGPYKAMILPSSKEEDKLLKKRYAVFNDDGTLAELKGFEVKRRGELQLVKIFQSQLFEKFLLGTTTQECYTAVAEVANQWLDVLFTKGENLEDEEVVDLIAENRSMSKTLAEYAGQKSTSISTAKRLAEFLGDQMVKDKGLACRFIISAHPSGAPVTERAIPVAIFAAEEGIKRTYLRKWLKDNSLSKFDLRSILDWDYYIERLGSVIQKLITIPAAMQKIPNPVPRIRHPEWLQRRVIGQVDRFKQNKVTDFFTRSGKHDTEGDTQPVNAEDFTKDVSTGIYMSSFELESKVAMSTRDEEPKGPSLPDPTSDYPNWVRIMRGRWKSRLVSYHEGSPSATVPKIFGNIRGHSNRQWDIIQIRPSSIPGRFVLWLFVDDEHVSVALRIQREFYIHLKKSSDDICGNGLWSAEKVTRHLPRDAPCVNLYKISVSETRYQESKEDFINLMNDPNVDSVYELQVPLWVRAILRLGGSCSSCESGLTLNKAKNIGFDLHQLDRPSDPRQNRYLNRGKGGKYILFYHAKSNNTTVHVFALFTPTGSVKLHLVDPATRRQPITRLGEIYQEMLHKRQSVYGPCTSIVYLPNLEFTTTYHTSELTALKGISRELGLFQDQSMTLVISSTKDRSYYEKLIPKISKFPVLSMSRAKVPHNLDVFPWQVHVASKMISRYLSFGPWIDRMILMSEYYEVPIGHIEGDQPLILSDLSFARRLSQQDIVLWWAPGDKPDFGGAEADQKPQEDLPKLEFSSPGLYVNVCLELSVRNLAVNSVLQCIVLNELEGSGGTSVFDSVTRSINEYVNNESKRDLTLGQSNISSLTFSVLKAMVKTWLLDKIQSNFESPSTIAIDHFWRWVSSTISCMHDPSIHHFVLTLMRKTFIQMLAEFKRLGSEVVYADFSRIILATTKPPGTAHAYATYIKTAIAGHELFQHTYLRTERFCDFLLFMDAANWGAVVCEDPLTVEPPKEVPIELKWNLAQFLPLPIQRDFHTMVQFYILELFRIRRKVDANGRRPQMVHETVSDRRAANGEETELITDFIVRRLTRKLFKNVDAILERYNRSMLDAKSAEEWMFPVLPGSYFCPTNPLLEFIKSLCAVFALAKNYNVEIGILKRNALELIGVREFANDAAFRNPCDPIKLSNIPCRHCDALKDFDFCRDPDLLPNNIDVNPKWLCSHCGGEFDKANIEFILIQVVHESEITFSQQDLRCMKCQSIQCDNISRHCHCSGTYQLSMTKVDFRRRLRTFLNIAHLHNFSRLKESAQALLSK